MFIIVYHSRKNQPASHSFHGQSFHLASPPCLFYLLSFHAPSCSCAIPSKRTHVQTEHRFYILPFCSFEKKRVCVVIQNTFHPYMTRYTCHKNRFTHFLYKNCFCLVICYKQPQYFLIICKLFKKNNVSQFSFSFLADTTMIAPDKFSLTMQVCSYCWLKRHRCCMNFQQTSLQLNLENVLIGSLLSKVCIKICQNKRQHAVILNVHKNAND